MTGSYDSYEAAVRDAWQGWWVTWPLSRRVRVGDAFDTSGGTSLIGLRKNIEVWGKSWFCQPSASVTGPASRSA